MKIPVVARRKSTAPVPGNAVKKTQSDSQSGIYLVLALCATAIYAQTGWFRFINYDDPEYVTRNPHVLHGFTSEGFTWAFHAHAANWFPLTWMSHMLDCQLFGLSSGAHHLMNATLHTAATLLLFAFLNRATASPRPSALVSCVFAVHPLHAESVAWVAERKDVLSAVFWFAALWAYVRYAERPSLRRYWPVVVLFALGLMAKPMIVTLPFVLLLADIWPLRRGIRIREKLPLFTMAAAVAVVTYAAQSTSGAVKPLGAFPFGLRVENASLSYLIYLAKIFWPSRMAAFYPYPLRIPAWEAILAALVLAGITAVALLQRRSRPYLMVGWLWFLGTLIPVIGLVQAGTQARADRYMYVPMVGIGIMLAWAVAELPRARMVLMAGLLCTLPVAWAQTSYWRDSETLWRHALDVTRENYVAEHNLGSALLDDPARLPEAISHLQAALRLNPHSAGAHTDLGSALAQSGRPAEAVAEFRAALAFAPGSAIVHNNLANALGATGQWPEAIAEYESALRIDPDYQDARKNLAIARQQLAAAHFQAGLAAAKAGRTDEALAELNEAVRLAPDDPEAQNDLGVVLSGIAGKLQEAAAHFEAALRLKPDYQDARVNLETAQNELRRGRK